MSTDPKGGAPSRIALDPDALFSNDEPPRGAVLEGEALEQAYWRIRGRERELARQQAFWASTNDALANAYAELERKSAELDAARQELVRLNEELEARVAAQVSEIVARAREVDVLNAQLRMQVRERSHELAAALEKLAQNGGSAGLLASGEEIDGRVRIVCELGQGGMGAVFLAQDLASEQLVAVKVLSPRTPPTPQLLQRFLGEARAAASVAHPAIIRSLAIDLSADGRIYQILEYVRGKTLSERLEAGPGDPSEIARLGAVIADALAAAHELGVVHRDVKPSNILLCLEPPCVKVFDFGIAKLRDGADIGQDSPRVTSTGELVGTPEYISPEQVFDASTVGPPSDVYSLGIVLFEWLTGRRPFDGNNATSYLLQHVSERPPSLGSVVPSAPPSLGTIVDRCLEKQANARPTAAELARELAAIADALEAPPAATLVQRVFSAPTAGVALSTAPTMTERRSVR
ncbi:serine/threonine protein kinase [Labilithrix luteola]|uniref:Serine/threonine protein kinase n=1 Tax=Labilithrix luteola TaxID=1391654 RepID=A0A0K1QEY1_9BACT|nr:serine/threonine-protein kinase [Labilithrix luteola]AKV03995.1 serine/threonine protein kinase [Labilithrix luteola]